MSVADCCRIEDVTDTHQDRGVRHYAIMQDGKIVEHFDVEAGGFIGWPQHFFDNALDVLKVLRGVPVIAWYHKASMSYVFKDKGGRRIGLKSSAPSIELDKLCTFWQSARIQ